MGGWRSRLGAACAAGLLAAAGLATWQAAAGSAPAYTPGQGYAAAQALALDDAYSSAQLGVIVGDATSQYQDGTGTATGAALDSGFITLLSELQTCGAYAYPAGLVPPTTSVSTNDNGNTTAVSATNQGVTTAPAGAVRVAARPNATGQTVIDGANTAIPGLVSLAEGTVDTSASSDPSGQVRSVVADAEDGTVSLLGGLIELHGLHWNASLRVAGADNTDDHRVGTPTFDIGSISVGGIDVPFHDQASYAASLASLNALTSPLGVTFSLPAVTETTTGGSSAVTIGPMQIALGGKTVAGSTLDALLGGATLPQLEDDLKPGVFDPTTCTELGGLLGPVKPLNADWNLLGAGYPIILGAVVASLDGGGSLNLELGGATASIDDTAYATTGFGSPSFTQTTVEAPGTPGSPARPGTPAVAGSAPVAGAAAPSAPAGPVIRRLVVTHASAVCRTVSPVGRPMCWGGHAAVGGIAAAVLVAGLLAGDEAVRRRRDAPVSGASRPSGGEREAP